MVCDCGCTHLTIDQFLDPLEAEIGEVDDDGRNVAPTQTTAKASQHFRIECCARGHVGDRVMEAGSPGAPTSHGYCARCLAVEMAAV